MSSQSIINELNQSLQQYDFEVTAQYHHNNRLELVISQNDALPIDLIIDYHYGNPFKFQLNPPKSFGTEYLDLIYTITRQIQRTLFKINPKIIKDTVIRHWQNPILRKKD